MRVCAFLKRPKNDFQHGFRLRQHFVVPEAQNTEAFGIHQRRSAHVIFGFVDMLAAVEFEDEFCLEAREV